MKLSLFTAIAPATTVSGSVLAQQSGDATPVTVENFIRAESNLYMSAVALKEGGFGKFEHHRELSPIDAQTIIRQNRDTLYSAAVFDLDAGQRTHPCHRNAARCTAGDTTRIGPPQLRTM